MRIRVRIAARAGLRVAGALAAAMLLAAAPALAAGRLEKIEGHLGVGYAKLFAENAPGGSFSLDAGLDYPVAPEWRAGVGLGYQLLGSRTLRQGSLFAIVDYSLFEMLALAHWESPRLGPVGRLSFGPGLFSARAELSTAGTGASFSRFAVEEVAPGIALQATLLSRRRAPVRVGLELGTRVAFLADDIWTLAAARLAFHY